MYSAADYLANLFSVTIVLKDFANPECPYGVDIYHVNNKVDGVDALIGYNGLIFQDTTIPDLIISTINHKTNRTTCLKPVGQTYPKHQSL